MTRRGEVRLRWALVNGERVEASSFVDVHPDDRPIGHCVCCGERIRWQAGKLWREHNGPTPHVAHLPDSACSTVSSGESAEHLNAKCDLADKLASLREFRASWICKCAWSRVVTVAQGWTRVALEYRSQQTTRVPDVALLDATGAIVLAIEIVHTHAVDEKKAANYAAASIPWIEVTVEDAVAWQSSSTWAVKAVAHGNVRTEPCEVCKRLLVEKAERERAEREARQRAWREASERAWRETRENEAGQARERADREDYYDQILRERREAREAYERDLFESLSPEERDEVLRLKRLRAARYHVLREYETNPPLTRIAVSASIDADRTWAFAAFCKVDFDGPVIVREVSQSWVDSWEDAMKVGVAECVRYLSEKAPGRKATICTNSNANALNTIGWLHPECDERRFVLRLQAEICRRGHYMQFATTKSGPMLNEKIAAALRRAHKAAEATRFKRNAA